MATPEKLEQVCVSLPKVLMAFVKWQAEQQDRTLGGQLRHYAAEFHRLAGSPAPPQTNQRAAPQIKFNSESIAEGKAKLASWEQEREKLRQRQRRTEGTTAGEDARIEVLTNDIDYIKGSIALAERMITPTNSGAQHGG